MASKRKPTPSAPLNGSCERNVASKTNLENICSAGDGAGESTGPSDPCEYLARIETDFLAAVEGSRDQAAAVKAAREEDRKMRMAEERSEKERKLKELLLKLAKGKVKVDDMKSRLRYLKGNTTVQKGEGKPKEVLTRRLLDLAEKELAKMAAAAAAPEPNAQQAEMPKPLLAPKTMKERQEIEALLKDLPPANSYPRKPDAEVIYVDSIYLLAEALKDAPEGSVLLLAPGCYRLRGDCNGNWLSRSLEIIGTGKVPSEVVITEGLSLQLEGPAHVRFANLTIRATVDAFAVYVEEHAALQMDGCDLDAPEDGVVVCTDAAALIKDCTIKAYHSAVTIQPDSMAVALVNSRFKECGNNHLEGSHGKHPDNYKHEKGYSSAIALEVGETIPAMLRKDSRVVNVYDSDGDEKAHDAGDGKLEMEAEVAEVCKNRMRVKLTVTGCSTPDCCGHALGMRAGRDMSSCPKARVRLEDGVLVSGIRNHASWDSGCYGERRAGNMRLKRHLPALLEYVRANNVDMGPGNDFSGAERCTAGGCEGCAGVSSPGLCLIKLRYEDGLSYWWNEEEKVHEVPAGPALTADTLKPCTWHNCEWFIYGKSTQGGLVKELLYCKGGSLPISFEGGRVRCFIGSMSVPMRLSKRESEYSSSDGDLSFPNGNSTMSCSQCGEVYLGQVNDSCSSRTGRLMMNWAVQQTELYVCKNGHVEGSELL